MTVDVRLLAILALPLAYLFALMHAALWLRQREQRAHLHWATANGVAAIGATLLVLRAVLPLWVTTSLANSVILASSFVIWVAMARFGGRAPSWRPFAVAIAVFFCLFQGLWLVTADLGMRVLLASLASAAANAGVGLELLRGQQPEPLRARAFLAAVFALHGLFYMFRAATAVTLDASQDFMQANGIQNLTVSIAALKMIAWNLGAVWMVRERLRPR